jgi:hypothetical protein
MIHCIQRTLVDPQILQPLPRIAFLCDVDVGVMAQFGAVWRSELGWLRQAMVLVGSELGWLMLAIVLDGSELGWLRLAIVLDV